MEISTSDETDSIFTNNPKILRHTEVALCTLTSVPSADPVQRVLPGGFGHLDHSANTNTVRSTHTIIHAKNQVSVLTLALILLFVLESRLYYTFKVIHLY